MFSCMIEPNHLSLCFIFGPKVNRYIRASQKKMCTYRGVGSLGVREWMSLLECLNSHREIKWILTGTVSVCVNFTFLTQPDKISLSC